uniref:ATP synthase complex subunit 8 n=1 Tax=Amblyrhynchus cristatus TaxID=51208 RepID=A0A0U2H585_AMBCR|nr:ATP synthase F0 subunit 8 [Amblyrhynchus cristatus]ALE29395.1 ATP synthase F0 subunit 8 [Amblyrhynchus cristatus]
MPQLNPSPWFLIFLLTWTVLTTTLLNKTLHSKLPNSPTPKEPEQPPTETWIWPWH